MVTIYTFTGREFDFESGLNFHRNRYYDPRTGRFLQQDLLGFAGGDLNLYRYVGNNPVNFVDPFGLLAQAATLRGTAVRISPPLIGIGAALAFLFAVIEYELTFDDLIPGGRDNDSTTPNLPSTLFNDGKSPGEQGEQQGSQPSAGQQDQAEEGEGPSEQADPNQVGSYTTTHKSGKTYSGKGPKSRMEQSAKEKSKRHSDETVDKEWKPAKNDAEAFKDEDRRIEQHGGVRDSSNYNIRNSPGQKLRGRD